MAEIDNLLKPMVVLNASDLHLRVDIKPRYRLDGRLKEPTEVDAMPKKVLLRVLREILSEREWETFKHTKELDFTYETSYAGRFRCNFFIDNHGPGAVIRRIAGEIPSIKELGLPQELEQFAHLTRGLVLVTGSSGSGKSSTLASLLETINLEYRKHIITLEDPIEYVYQNKNSIVHQRGMHHDIKDFQSGIRAALRQDPDVIMIGELRDQEDIRMALTAAETGALVFATLHTNSAADSIDRIIDVFPAQEQAEVRTQLSQSLAGIVCQALLERADGDGRVPAIELLVQTPAVGSVIREGNTQDIVNIIQSGKAHGMLSLDDGLEAMVRQGVVSPQTAFLYAQSKARFEKLFKGKVELASRRRREPALR